MDHLVHVMQDFASTQGKDIDDRLHSISKHDSPRAEFFDQFIDKNLTKITATITNDHWDPDID